MKDYNARLIASPYAFSSIDTPVDRSRRLACHTLDTNFNHADQATESTSSTMSAVEVFNTFLIDSKQKTMTDFVEMIDLACNERQWKLIDPIFYHMRTNYSIVPDKVIWERIIIAAANSSLSEKKGNDVWIVGKKYLQRMVKFGVVPSAKPYEMILDCMAKSEAWKEISTFYAEYKDSPAFNDKTASQVMWFYERLLFHNARHGRWKESKGWLDEIQSFYEGDFLNPNDAVKYDDEERMIPSLRCYRFVVEACRKGGKLEIAMDYLNQMEKHYLSAAAVEDLELPPPGA